MARPSPGMATWRFGRPRMRADDMKLADGLGLARKPFFGSNGDPMGAQCHMGLDLKMLGSYSQ